MLAAFGTAREGDALVTDEIGRAVGVRTASCVPILLLDRSKHAVSAVHAGWRGTDAQIVSRTIQKLRDDFGSVPDKFLAAIGPCIRQCCYEVGSEVAERFPKIYTTSSERSGKWHLNLAAANRSQMLESGLLPDRIFDLEACTVCRREDFFSYRREPDKPWAHDFFHPKSRVALLLAALQARDASHLRNQRRIDGQTS